MTATPHLPRRSAEEQIRLEATLRDIFERKLCFNELLGFKVESLDPAAPQISFAMRRDLIGHYQHGRLHGGVIATVLDTVGGLAATVAIAEKFNGETTEQVGHRFGRIGTIDMRVDYLRPGHGEWFEAKGTILRTGNKVAVTRMELHNDGGDLIAIGTGAYTVA